MKHVHRLRPHWILQTGIPGSDQFYRIVFWATCLTCGLQGAFAAMQSTTAAEGTAAGAGAMTLADLMDYLRERGALPEPLSDTVISRTLLMAYDMGYEQGRKEAHGAPSDGR